MFSHSNRKEPQMDLRYESVNSAASAPEPLGTVMGKLGVVWAGLFAGISLGDVVLFATLVYTVLQIALLIAERIVKPIMAAREVRRALLKTGVITASVDPQESKEK